MRKVFALQLWDKMFHRCWLGSCNLQCCFFVNVCLAHPFIDESEVLKSPLIMLLESNLPLDSLSVSLNSQMPGIGCSYVFQSHIFQLNLTLKHYLTRFFFTFSHFAVRILCLTSEWLYIHMLIYPFNQLGNCFPYFCLQYVYIIAGVVWFLQDTNR